MVTCPSCGSENTDNMNFCGSCGKNLSAALDASETAVRRVLANRYELVCELGRGAMGVVYLARDRTLDGREVAVKILPKEMATDSRALARLKREAMTAMEIAHPNVVRLHTFEETEDDHFLVMEYIDGPNLLHVLTGMPDGKLDVDTFLCHADGICSGVEYAHRRNVVHSDLKPANIMLDAEGTAKITDFGVAQVVRETMSRVSLSETAGTLLYMSPEVLEGAHNTVLSDQYALGITFYELLIGEPPFVRGDVTYQHIHAQPVPIPGVSEHVNDAILKALAKKPDDRWPDVETFGKALQGDLGADWEERRTILIPKVNLDDWRENDTTVRAPANGTGRLFVTSEPAEASVFIDGRQMGATGALIDTVPSGQRTVRLSFPEYDDLTRTVTIEPNRITRIDGLKLEPALPSVNIISNPLNALITFDGESAGRTPTTLRRIAEGEHTIKIVKPRYVEVERIVQVFPPVTDLEFELEAGAVEFRGRWVSEAARDGILTKETEEQRRHRTASLKEQIETALESRAWDDAEILVADLKPLEAATVSDYEERVEQGRQADREEDECLQKQWDRRRRQARIRRFWIAAAVSVGLCIGAVNLWQMYHDMQVADMVRQIDSAISAHDFGVAMVLTTELQGLEPEAAVPFPDRIRSARIAYMDGQIAQAVSEHDFDSATEITVRLSLLSTPVAEEATQRIEQARQRYISELQNDVRGAWRAGDTALRDAVFRQLRDLDPASSAFERYRYMPGECIRTITGNSDVVTSVFVTGNRVVTGAKDHTISMWNAGSGRRIRTFTGHTEEVAAVTVAGDRIISGSRDRTIRMWNLNSGELLRTLSGHTHDVLSVCVAGGRILSGSYDDTIKEWNEETGRFIGTLNGHSNSVNTVAATADRIVSGSYQEIRVWDFRSGRLLKTLTGHSGSVLSVAVAGERVVSGSWDRTVRVWDLNTGQLIRTLSGHTEGVNAVVVRGNRIVSGSEDGTVRVWDLNSGQLLKTLTGHTDAVTSIALTENRIVSGSADHTVKVWRAPWE